MDQLVQMVSQKTGIAESQARQAVDVILGFMKERLPSQVSGLIDRVASGEDVSKEGGDLLKGAGKMFGR
ncbi:MAG: HU family DNA-binding protein [Chloroflexi bacterium]|nr:HU family DNA-binding protein [Chloroflexota bacterium]